MRRLIWVGSALVAVGSWFAACKLDLDESLIPHTDASAGGASGAGGGSGGVVDSGFGGVGATGGKGDGGPCDADTQCKTDAACLEGRCASGQCAFDLCPSKSACEGRTCEATSGKCSASQPFGFKATSLELSAEIGCGNVAQRCVAGFGDLVFVATADGALNAFRTTNPAAPQKLTVDAPTFTVARLVAAENRLLILSAVASDKLQVAWLDPPTDPNATTLALNQVGVNLSGATDGVFPAGAQGFFLVENSSATFFPAALLEPPVANNATVSQYPSTGLAPGASIVASSGKRLVSFRVDTSNTPVVPSFTLVSAAGTTSAQNGSEAAMAFEAPASLSAHFFASAYDGSLLWSTNRVTRDDAGTPETSAVVLRWPLTAGGNDFSGTLEIDLASYSSAGWSTVRRGPVALVDPSTILATVAYPVDPQLTLVRSVHVSNGALVLGSATATLPFTVNQVGVAANRRVGVVLTPADTTLSLKATLHVFAPGCT